MKGESAQTDPLIEAAASFIDARGLLSRGEAVLVAVSGGADSVALLAALRELARRPGRAYRLTAAHLNHRLRDDADADAEFVAELARGWEIPCIVASRDVPGAAAGETGGVEAAARRLRYEFLAEAAATCGASAVAVGHHADDNAETILYRIVRGTHLRGLSGIPAKRPLAGGAVRLVRPLLEVRREEIEACCRRAGLTWRTDETNIDTAYRRNFVRHELLPLLRERLNARADDALLRLARAAGEVEAHLAQQGSAALVRARKRGRESFCSASPSFLSAASLAGEPAVVRTYALRAALEQLHLPLGELTAERLAELAELPQSPPPAAVSLPGGFLARREGGLLIIEARGPEAGPTEWQTVLQCPGRTLLPDGRAVACEIGELDPAAFQAHCRDRPEGVEMLDADSIRGRLICRRRREGDAFVPLGAPGRKSVSDFLTDLKLPRRLRDEALCIADEAGLVYLAPLRIAERAKVTPATQRLLRIEMLQPRINRHDAP